MPNDRDPVQPTPFDAPVTAPAETAAANAAPAAGNRGVLFALIALLVVAALVILWLPGKVAETPDAPPPVGDSAPAPQAQAPAPAAPPAPAPAPAEAGSPFAEAIDARLRGQAQAVLSELLDIQFALQEQGVEQWASEAFAAAGATALAGDELYRQRQFESAQAKYEQALAALQSIQAGIPEEVEHQLEALRLAIEKSDEGVAARHLEIARRLASADERLPGLEARYAQIPAVSALLDEAAALEESSELNPALAALEKAVELDPDHQRAAAELARVGAAVTRRDFQQAMSDGYAALAEKRFDAANRFFREAAKLSPDSPEAGNALREVTEQRAAFGLVQLSRRGAAAESAERWQEAVTIYEKALATDASVLFAGEGLARAKPRAQLDNQLALLIREPQRLEDVKVAATAQSLLDQAHAVSAPGPVLSGQVEQLGKLLTKANTPITVTLRSDLQTAVILQRVARLGMFDQQSLELRPGTYTAVGSRRGFRDVRRKFTVSHDSATPVITINCTEPI